MLFKLTFITVALVALASAANYKRVTCPDGVNTCTNEACCVFFALRDDLQNNLFNKQCGEDVHESLRLTFHDGVGFSQSGAFKGNGADGSIILFKDIETNYVENAGTDDGVDALAPFLQNHSVSAGDLIQFAAAVGLTNCPGAPQLQFLAGRPNATIPADDGTVPQPQDSVDSILARFADVGISSDEVIHLLASHTVARSDTLVAGHTAVPFDSTPFTFDTQIFLEMLLAGTAVPFGVNNTVGAEVDSPLASEGEMRLQSDFALSRDSRTACEWQSMVDNQSLMMSNFQTAMKKLSNIGQDTSKLVDCTEVLPFPLPPAAQQATFPAGTSQSDLQQVCSSAFPTLSVNAGQATQIPGCPNGDLDASDC
ncbi:manganese peroxidase 3 [Phellopilus nigrolimitatus]|nr:manganese peroxidase 3 [Phellopilus nigrolimitatus]